MTDDGQNKFLFQVVVLVYPPGHDFSKQPTPRTSGDGMVIDFL
jgi:hypothetical protein